MSTTFETYAAQAVKLLKPDATSFEFNEEEIVDWKDNVSVPTKAQIDSKIVELVAENDAQLYARKRSYDYPTRGDQFDMIYKDMKNNTTTHKDAVEAVKTKWPKDNSGPV